MPIIGPNILLPLSINSNDWFRHNSSGSSISADPDSGLIFSVVSGSSGWSCYILSRQNTYRYSDLYNKYIKILVEFRNVSLGNNSIINWGIATFPSPSPNSSTSRTSFSVASQDPSLFLPTTNGIYNAIKKFDENLMQNRLSSFSESDYVGAYCYLNGYPNDTFTLKRLEIHIIH